MGVSVHWPDGKENKILSGIDSRNQSISIFLVGSSAMKAAQSIILFIIVFSALLLFFVSLSDNRQRRRLQPFLPGGVGSSDQLLPSRSNMKMWKYLRRADERRGIIPKTLYQRNDLRYPETTQVLFETDRQIIPPLQKQVNGRRRNIQYRARCFPHC